MRKKYTNIKDFIKDCLNSKSNRKIDIEINRISDDEAKQIRKLVGIDLEGYIRVLDNYSVAHVLKKHGNKDAEKLRGQIHVTEEDFEMIAIIAVPQNIAMTTKNRLGKDVVLYQATICHIYFYIEEIREGRKQLVLNTMYKRKPPG